MSFKGRTRLADFRWNHLTKRLKLQIVGIFIVWIIFALPVVLIENILIWIPIIVILILFIWTRLLLNKESNHINTQYKPELNKIRREHGMKEL